MGPGAWLGWWLSWGVLQAQSLPEEEDLSILVNTPVEVASKTMEKAGDAAGVVSILTRDELIRFGGMTLSEILNRVPGLVHVSNYHTDRSMMAVMGDNIRNQRTNLHVLLLVDGRPLREVQGGGIKSDIYEAFPVLAIDRIEVVKGPGSVLYGSDAFAAVINVVTVRPRWNGLTIQGSAGASRAFQHALAVDLAAGEFFLGASLQGTRRPDWPISYELTTRPSGPTTATVPFLLRAQSLGAHVRSGYRGWTWSGAFLRYDTPFMVADYQSIGDSRLKRAFSDIGYRAELGGDTRLQANLTFGRCWFKSLSPVRPPIDRDSEELLGEVSLLTSPSPNVRLLVGGSFSRAKGEERNPLPPYAVTAQGSRPSRAAYAQVEWFNGDWKSILGFQALRVGGGRGTGVPRFALVWQPRGSLSAKLLFGEAFRAPYINESFIRFPGILEGNPALNPERMRSLQAAVTLMGSRWEATLSAFRNRQWDLIAFRYISGNTGTLQFQNFGHATLSGVEAEGKVYFNPMWMLEGSLAWQRTPSGELSGWSNVGAKLGISCKGRLGVCSLFNVHQGPVDARLYNPRSNPPARAYDLLNLHVALDLAAWPSGSPRHRIQVTCQGENLLGRDLWVPATGDVWPASVPFKQGRTVLLGVRLVL